MAFACFGVCVALCRLWRDTDTYLLAMPYYAAKVENMLAFSVQTRVRAMPCHH